MTLDPEFQAQLTRAHEELVAEGMLPEHAEPQRILAMWKASCPRLLRVLGPLAPALANVLTNRVFEAAKSQAGEFGEQKAVAQRELIPWDQATEAAWLDAHTLQSAVTTG